MQFALDTLTWDIGLDATGNIAMLKGTDKTSRADLLCQRVRHRLQTFMGECYLDRSVGVPYFQEVMRKNPDLQKVRALMVAQISGVPGVAKVEKLNANFDAQSRNYNLYFRLKSTDGETIDGEV